MISSRWVLRNSDVNGAAWPRPLSLWTFRPLRRTLHGSAFFDLGVRDADRQTPDTHHFGAYGGVLRSLLRLSFAELVELTGIEPVTS